MFSAQAERSIDEKPTDVAQVKAKTIRPLAVLTKDRNPALPDVPTLSETVMPGFDILAWAGMFGPANMPPEATKALAGAIEKALKQKEIRERFAAAGTDIYWSGPAEFDAFVKSELVKWTAAIKEAGIEPE